MSPKERLIKLVEDHFDGNPWLDVNIMKHLNEINYVDAAIKIGNANSIWQLVYHMMHWRITNMRRVGGMMIPAPNHNFIIQIPNQSKIAWEKLKNDFMKTHYDFVDFLKNFDESKMDEIYEGNGHTYYEHLQGILIHDAYHLGQIVLLRKLIENQK
jgi:uncharacterized damage-inducible protein DinB